MTDKEYYDYWIKEAEQLTDEELNNFIGYHGSVASRIAEPYEDDEFSMKEHFIIWDACLDVWQKRHPKNIIQFPGSKTDE